MFSLNLRAMGSAVSVDSLDVEQFKVLRATYDDARAAHTGEFTAEDEAALLAKLQVQLADMGGGGGGGGRVSAERGQRLADSTDRHDLIEVGDIVKAQPEGEQIFYEGHVSGLCEDGRLEVEFDDGTMVEVAPSAVRKVQPWTLIEVGDKVQARHGGGFQRYDAVVVSVAHGADGEPAYTVEYCDGEVEAELPPSHVDKVLSVRMNAAREWRKVTHVFKALNRMAGVGQLFTKMAEASVDSPLEPAAAAETKS